MAPGLAQNERRVDIQGIRGIAVLMVVGFHVGLPVPGGFLGVDVFFVISGYVITAGLLRLLDRDETFSLTSFLGRRVRRLLPALGFMLVVVTLLSMLLLSPLGPQQTTARMAMHAALWVANIEAYRLPSGYFDPEVTAYPLIHTWSLSVEEQFYLLFPVLVLITWKVRRRITDVRLMLLVGTVLSLILTVGLTHNVLPIPSSDPARMAFYAAPTRAWEFGVGALLAVLAFRTDFGSRSRRSNHRKMVGAFSVAGLAFSAFLITDQSSHPGLTTLLPVMSTAGLIWANLRWTSGRAFVWLGDLSYSWYLWHWPAISFTNSLISTSAAASTAAGLLSLVPAWLSYRFIENRFRVGGHRATVRVPVVVFTATGTSLVVALVLSVGATANWWSSSVSQLVAQTTPLPISYAAGCHQGAAPSTLVGTACEWSGGTTGSTVVLVGDSNAAMYSDGLAAAARETGQKLIVSTRSSCPLVEIVQQMPGFDHDACEAYVDRTIADLQASPPMTIITGAAGNQIGDPEIALRDTDGQFTNAASEKAAIWESGLTSVLTKLRSAGHRVVVMQVIPHFIQASGEAWRPSNCSMAQLLAGASICAPSQTLAAADTAQSFVMKAFATATHEAGAELVSFREYLCPDSMCSAYQRGEWKYRDGTHISPGASRSLTPRLAKILYG